MCGTTDGRYRAQAGGNEPNGQIGVWSAEIDRFADRNGIGLGFLSNGLSQLE
jgi:hypothetical protein